MLHGKQGLLCDELYFFTVNTNVLLSRAHSSVRVQSESSILNTKDSISSQWIRKPFLKTTSCIIFKMQRILKKGLWKMIHMSFFFFFFFHEL